MNSNIWPENWKASIILYYFVGCTAYSVWRHPPHNTEPHQWKWLAPYRGPNCGGSRPSYRSCSVRAIGPLVQRRRLHPQVFAVPGRSSTPYPPNFEVQVRTCSTKMIQHVCDQWARHHSRQHHPATIPNYKKIKGYKRIKRMSLVLGLLDYRFILVTMQTCSMSARFNMIQW